VRPDGSRQVTRPDGTQFEYDSRWMTNDGRLRAQFGVDILPDR